MRTALMPIAFSSALLFAGTDTDTFGIAKFHPTKAGTREWNSAHWDNGKPRTVKYDIDPYDPTNWTTDHSGGTDGFWIDGTGTMRMSGSGPRFHINSLDSSKVSPQFFRNTEYTAYFMSKGSAGAAWGGMIVGARSGPLGHASSGGNDCDATTYYGRFRNDGKWDVEKELKHPGSTYWSGTGFGKQDPLWNGAALPRNRWIGMKYLVYDIDAGTHVKMELWIDSVSNGNPVNGGIWRKVGEVADTGNWPSGDVSGCGYAQNMVITPGHGTFLMRTDGDTAIYKMVSIREIDPSVSSGTRLAEHFSRAIGYRISKISGKWTLEQNGRPIQPLRIDWLTFAGKIVSVPSGPGVYQVRIFLAGQRFPLLIPVFAPL